MSDVTANVRLSGSYSSAFAVAVPVASKPPVMSSNDSLAPGAISVACKSLRATNMLLLVDTQVGSSSAG